MNFKKGDIVKSRRDGSFWKVGQVFAKTMELWAYNMKPTTRPNWGMTVDVSKDYEIVK